MRAWRDGGLAEGFEPAQEGLQGEVGARGAGGEKDFGEEGGGPEMVLEGGADRAGDAGREPGGGEDEGDLPEGVEDVGEEPGCQGRWE